MGIFHKNIQDVKRAIEKGDFKTAKDILDLHISDEHNMDSNFNKIIRDLHHYQFLLSHLKDICTGTGASSDIIEAKKKDICSSDLKELNYTRSVLIASMNHLIQELKRE